MVQRSLFDGIIMQNGVLSMRCISLGCHKECSVMLFSILLMNVGKFVDIHRTWNSCQIFPNCLAFDSCWFQVVIFRLLFQHFFLSGSLQCAFYWIWFEPQLWRISDSTDTNAQFWLCTRMKTICKHFFRFEYLFIERGYFESFYWLEFLLWFRVIPFFFLFDYVYKIVTQSFKQSNFLILSYFCAT